LIFCPSFLLTCGKGGGGRPDMAQAGEPDGAKAEAVKSAIAQEIAASLGA